jgi:hypothetical protein
MHPSELLLTPAFHESSLGAQWTGDCFDPVRERIRSRRGRIRDAGADYFVGVLLVMGAVSAAMLLFFWRRGWIGK